MASPTVVRTVGHRRFTLSPSNDKCACTNPTIVPTFSKLSYCEFSRLAAFDHRQAQTRHQSMAPITSYASWSSTNENRQNIARHPRAIRRVFSSPFFLLMSPSVGIEVIVTFNRNYHRLILSAENGSRRAKFVPRKCLFALCFCARSNREGRPMGERCAVRPVSDVGVCTKVRLTGDGGGRMSPREISKSFSIAFCHLFCFIYIATRFVCSDSPPLRRRAGMTAPSGRNRKQIYISFNL